MKVTYNWLKDFVDIKISPQALADKLTMAGLEVTSLEEKAGDCVFEIEITSNRPDWLSIIGIAREVAAITGRKLKLGSRFSVLGSRKYRAAKTGQINIIIEDKKDCPLYTAKIIKDVKVGVSPDWLKKRLELIGCRSVNNIVDITNYILFETGEPLHAFDLDKLSQDTIIVRRAKPNESITTIDGESRKLSPDILVIADKIKCVAIAGVMGGKYTEVSTATKNVLLEVAVFNPIVIRKGRQAIGLQSESAYRFERSVNPATVEYASSRAAELISKLAGGKCVCAKSSAKSVSQVRKIALCTPTVNKMLGINLSAAQIRRILNSLRFKTKGRAKNNLSVEIPSHRQDVNLEIDLIEELARIYGFENIPKTLPVVTPSLSKDKTQDLVSISKNILRGLGLNEAITYSLIDKELLKKFSLGTQESVIEIMNPLSEEQEILRPTLIPSLVRCVAVNLNQKQEFVNIFEMAKTFSHNQHKEELSLGIAMSGTRQLRLTQGLIREQVCFLHLKGILQALFEGIGIKNYDFIIKDNPSMVDVCVNKQRVGVLVNISKDTLSSLDIKNKEVFAAEISLEKLFPGASLQKKFLPLPKYPGIARDISLILKDDYALKDLLTAIEEKGKPLLSSVKIVDYYSGKQIPAGYRGMTLSCFYRSNERTLTDAEINPLQAMICELLQQKFGAKIR